MDDRRAKGYRPCDNCRRRKIRCLFPSEGATICVLCQSRNTECTYVQDAPRKKRALSPGGGRTLEDNRPKQRLRGSHDSGSVLRDYSNLPGQSLLKQTLGHQNRQSSSIYGATGDFDATFTNLLQCDSKGDCTGYGSSTVLRLANSEVAFAMRPDSDVEIEKELASLDAIESLVTPHGPDLVELYFRIVHPSFPILHKRVFLEKHGRTYRELTPTGLGAVYIMALGWWSFSPKLAKLPKPDVTQLEKLVLNMLFEVHARPKISDLQGGLVLMQRPDTNSWTMIGHLCSVAQNLGIDHDPSDWHVPDWERGVRKRVAWAVFMQDTWGALVYGRPVHLRSDDWDVPPLESSDFPETAKDDDDEEGSADTELGKCTFLHMVTLTNIVSDVLHAFYSLKALKRDADIHETLEIARPIQLRLKAWFSSLPSSLSVDEVTPRRLSSVGYLRLAYYTAEATLHRAILRASSMLGVNEEARLVTRKAATMRFTSAMDFVKRLKPEHLQSFWYFSSSRSLAIIGTLATTLAATSLDSQEREALTAQLAEYRWTLRISSNGADFMSYAVDVLDAQSQLLEQRPSNYGGQPADNLAASDQSPDSDAAIISPTDVGWGNGYVDGEPVDNNLDYLTQYNLDDIFSFQPGSG